MGLSSRPSRRGELVQDSAYMVSVPFFCPDTPPLEKNPLFLYSSDSFLRPYPFQADIVVDIDQVFELKVDALLCSSRKSSKEALGSQAIMDAAPPASKPELRAAGYVSVGKVALQERLTSIAMRWFAGTVTNGHNKSNTRRLLRFANMVASQMTQKSKSSFHF
ncbi:MAG: hypothetical protein R3C56_10530 [Pirellulaceae bacterium]